jgi:hypothetical protein
MPSPPSSATSNHLRLITGSANRSFGLTPQEVDAEPIQVDVRKPLTRRPGEHVELITLEGVALRPIREVAGERGICPETAVALVLERALIVQQPEINGPEGRLAHLEHLARQAATQTPLWDAHSDYLLHLLGHTPGVPWARPLHSPRAGLPIRLIDRINLRIPNLQEEPSEALPAAVKWEIAAVLAGETMSEWAYRSALSAMP